MCQTLFSLFFVYHLESRWKHPAIKIADRQYLVRAFGFFSLLGLPYLKLLPAKANTSVRSLLRSSVHV